MTTLILGHNREYKKEDIRCSPIDVNLWYDKPYKCVDILIEKDTADFEYNIYRNKNIDGFWIWEFSENNSYDTIIDCIGSLYWDKCRNKYKNQDDLLKTIKRVLTTGGKFYSYFGIYTKVDNDTLTFEPKQLKGYKYL